MYLKSLTLKGFKSFADKTKMVFDPGLSVVVGPNGSGKSNISDAVLWVLGTQSAKQLRGQAMEDVIFSGSAERGKVSMAEVTLVLDNSDHTLPIDYIEVAITRRMFRNGENEYLVNGAPARLMDVQDILHDSGLGRETHSIISQGKLDQVVTARPEDRRELIEEAAGIAKHRRRKERAAKKLVKMDENVRHLKTVLREVNRRIKPLEGQVDKATRANELSKRANELALKLSVHTLHEQEEKWNTLKEKRTQVEALQEVAQLEVEEKKAHLDKLTAILEEKGLFAGDIEESKGRLSAQSEGMRASLRLLEEKGRTLVERLSETRRSLSATSLEKHSAETALEELLANGAESQGELKAAHAELETLLNQDKKELEAEALQKKAIAKAEEEVSLAQSSADASELALSKAIASLANASDNISLFTTRKEELQEEVAQAKAELTQNKAAAKKAETTFLQTEKDKVAAEEKEVALEEELRGAKQEEAELYKQISLLDAKRQTIENLTKDLQADTHAKPTFLENAKAKKLFSQLDVPQSYATIFDLYLEGFLQYYVTDASQEVYKAALEKSDFSLFVKELMQPIAHAKKLPGVSLASLVQKEKTDEGLYQLLSRCYLVDTLEDALAGHKLASDVTFITKDHIRISPNGLFTKGSSSDSSKGLLSQVADGKQAEKDMQKAAQALEKKSSHIAKKEAELKAASEKTKQLSLAYETLKAERTMYAKETGRLEQSIEQLSAQLERLVSQNKQAQEEIDALKAEKTKQTKELENAKKTREKAEVEHVQQRKKLQDMQDAHAQTAEKITALKLRVAGLSEREHHFEARKQELDAQIKNQSEREEALNSSGEALEVLRRRIEPLHATIAAFDELLQNWIIRLNEQISAARSDSSSQSASLTGAQEALGKAQTNLSEQNEKLQALDVQKARLEVEVQHAVERVREVATIPFEEAILVELDAPVDEAEEELERLQQELASIGPINQVAAEEFEDLKERQTTISEALAELKSAKRAVDSVMASIEKKMREAFVETFASVDKNFQEVFALLFPGGKAHLSLTDEEDIQNAGLEIIAQPRGKRLPKLALMSGGEKSLTALAFLFAVYKTRTVPFYIFDEVEAALDDANLHKLLHAIQELKRTTQLIVITHQRPTMEEADVLWGVSMGTDGVSQVLSQRLQKTPERSA